MCSTHPSNLSVFLIKKEKNQKKVDCPISNQKCKEKLKKKKDKKNCSFPYSSHPLLL